MKWRYGIRNCIYPLQFQHIPSLAAVAARVLTKENMKKAPRLCNPGRKPAVIVHKTASQGGFL
jgi:hypothetical protein